MVGRFPDDPEIVGLEHLAQTGQRWDEAPRRVSEVHIRRLRRLNKPVRREVALEDNQGAQVAAMPHLTEPMIRIHEMIVDSHAKNDVKTLSELRGLID